MKDSQLAERIRTVLSGLSAQITLSEKDTICTAPVTAPETRNGELCVCLPGSRLMLSCPAETPGGCDLLLLAVRMASNLSRQSADTSADAALRSALTGGLAGYELEALQNTAPFRDGLTRVVMIFSIAHTVRDDTHQLLCDLTPMQEKDRLIGIDHHTAALIKAQDEDETADDLIQFCQALQETLLAETGLQMLAGISAPFTTADRLPVCCSEARTAIDVGRRFKPQDSVFAFTQLSLQRFLSEVPPDICRKYHELLFDASTERLFNEEMMYTIDMFFRKDLNLSDTARQLYIHRNTLVYRLDKVQKQTGLDLRSFRDAVTFKLLMELKKCSGEHEPH